MSVEENIQLVKAKISQACVENGRDPNEVNIVAVTKYVDIEQTKQVLDLGLQHIGENRVHLAVEKYDALHDRGTWHFIGNLQSKKVKQIIGKFDYIHSLDRLSLAEEIDKRAKQKQVKVKCFIQVNVSGEESKSGVEPDRLLEFAEQIKKLESIQVVGLMTMAPLMDNKELTRPIFRKLRESRDMLNDQHIFEQPLTELSMGMSNDFEIAVEEGATYVRLGSILLEH